MAGGGECPIIGSNASNGSRHFQLPSCHLELPAGGTATPSSEHG